MKQGIHLGDRRDIRSKGRWSRIVLAAGIGLSLYHGFSVLRVASEARDLERRLAALGLSALPAAENSLDEGERRRLETEVYPRFVSLLGVNAPGAPVTSAVLALVSEAIPDGIRLQAISLTTSGRSHFLNLTVTSEDASRVSAFQLALERDAAIDRTELLEERGEPGGGRAVRLRVQLASREDR